MKAPKPKPILKQAKAAQKPEDSMNASVLKTTEKQRSQMGQKPVHDDLGMMIQGTS